MAIEFPCPHCSQLLRVGEENAGKTAKCPKCEGLAKIPADPAAAPGSPGGTSLGAPLPSSFSQPNSSPFGETPAAKNPFSDGGGFGTPSKPANPYASGGEVNPYSSPSPVGSPYNLNDGAEVARSGLPWDKRRSLGTWWETLTTILGSSNDAFRRMRITGGFGIPIGYAMIGLAIGSLGNFIFSLGILGVLAATGMKAEQLTTQFVLQVASTVLTPLLGATLLCFIQAGIVHVCLIMVGGEKNGYETTFRVCAYNMGAFGAFNAIPIIGPCVGLVWQIITTIIGLAEAHETTGGKAAAAYLIALMVSIVACAGFAFIGVLVIAVFVGGLM